MPVAKGEAEPQRQLSPLTDFTDKVLDSPSLRIRQIVLQLLARLAWDTSAGC